MAYCENCGEKLSQDSLFCPKCGHRVSSGDKEETSAASTADTSIPVEPKDTKKKMSKGLMALIISAICLLVGGSGYAAFSLFYPSGDNRSAATASGETEESKLPSTKVSAKTEKKQSAITLKINQVDTSDFPNIRIYVDITDTKGKKPDSIKKEDLVLTEVFKNGSKDSITVSSLLEGTKSEGIKMNLVMDQSGSMDESSLMSQAKAAAITLLDEVQTNKKDQVAITAFDDVVYVKNDFTNDYNGLKNIVNSLAADGQTALYDAVYAALLKTNSQSGSRCVILFTDGKENCSDSTYDDVVRLSTQTNIPVYTIGIGTAFSQTELENLAEATNGRYCSAEGTDIRELLSEIYQEIYEQQINQYVIEATCMNEEALSDYRYITINCSDNSDFKGSSNEQEYTPKPDVDETIAEDQTIHRYEFVVGNCTWDQAFEQAKQKGGYLAHINSVAENEHIIEQIKAQGMDKIHFILGGRRDSNSSKYYWVNKENKTYGKEINSDTYWVRDLWMTDEPSFSDKGLEEAYLCIFYFKDAGTWVWNDVPNNIMDVGQSYYDGKIGYIIEYD